MRVGNPQVLNMVLDMKMIIYKNIIINHAKFIIGKCVNNATVNQKTFDRSRTIIGI